jgi:uncharacterized protein (TIGR00297 family)
VLGLFVVSGSVLGRMVSEARSGSGRRAAQVGANGWTAALGAALIPYSAETGWAVLAGGLAAAQADTWATEFGLMSSRGPVLLTTGTAVPRGTSGGVTALGTLSGVVGAAAMGGVTGALTRDALLAIVATAAGTAGLLADSLLGATWQAAYRCAACDAPSDDPRHCGTPARLVRGRRWLTNDGVNALATGLGAALAAGAVAAW